MRHDQWKLVRFGAERDRKHFARREVELYDLDADPGETRNVVDEHPGVAARLGDALDRWVATTPQYRGDPDAGDTAIDEQTRKMLRALGYVDSP